MRYLSIFLTYSIFSFGIDNSILQEFPTSTKEITYLTSSTLKDFDEQFLEFTKQPLNKLDFNKAVTDWGNIIAPLFSKGIVLSFLSLTTHDPEVIQQANLDVKLLQQKVWMSMNDPKALSVFLHFVKNPENQKSMTPYQVYTVDCILQNIKTSSLQQEVLSAQKSLSNYKSQPFIYTKGDKEEKTLPDDSKITLVSWNVCLFESNISMLFGGVLPWENRIERIMNKIQDLDPDILCLQEVFSSKAGLAIVENLKSKYAHFYYSMGPNPIGFSVDTLGIPGGLFVASKYPLKNENFTSFTKEQTPLYRTYGFFTANIYNKDKPIAHLVTTHLQPGYEEKDKEYRALQSKAILSNLQDIKIPTLLCGDLNIAKGSFEAQEIFKPYESSSYQGIDWTCCELRDYWWKAKQNVEQFSSLPPDKEWLDYFLYLKNSSKIAPKFSTQIIVVNDLANPENALSDHQLLFTTITLP